MELIGSVSGNINLGGSGDGGLDDVLVKKTTDYESVVENDKAYIDLSWAASKTSLDDYVTLDDMSDYYDKIEVNGMVNQKQDKLTAGDNITINNNVISSSGGGVNFSTTEQEIGVWIDGKKLYRRSFILTASNLNNSPFVTDIPSNIIDNIWIDASATFIKTADSSGNYITAVGYWNPANNFDCRLQTNQEYIYLQTWHSGGMNYQDGSILTLLYTKK